MKSETKRNLILLPIMIILALILFVTLKPVNSDIKKDLVKRAMISAVVDGKIPDYNLLTDQKNIIISSNNIDTNLLPTLPNIELIVLSPAEIKEKANEEGDFLYLEFSKINLNNWDAKLIMELKWADINRRHFNGGILTVNFYNLLAKWIQKESIVLWVA
ncbi:MAG: hypothetical protein ACYCYI_05860 [Saccharofermentanales bacterium]